MCVDRQQHGHFGQVKTAESQRHDDGPWVQRLMSCKMNKTSWPRRHCLGSPFDFDDRFLLAELWTLSRQWEAAMGIMVCS